MLLHVSPLPCSHHSGLPNPTLLYPGLNTLKLRDPTRNRYTTRVIKPVFFFSLSQQLTKQRVIYINYRNQNPFVITVFPTHINRQVTFRYTFLLNRVLPDMHVTPTRPGIMGLAANSSLGSRFETMGPAQEPRNWIRTPTRKWVQPAIPRRRSPSPENASENCCDPVF